MHCGAVVSTFVGHAVEWHLQRASVVILNHCFLDRNIFTINACRTLNCWDCKFRPTHQSVTIRLPPKRLDPAPYDLEIPPLAYIDQKALPVFRFMCNWPMYYITQELTSSLIERTNWTAMGGTVTLSHSAVDNSNSSTRCTKFDTARPTVHLYIFEYAKLINSLRRPVGLRVNLK